MKIGLPQATIDLLARHFAEVLHDVFSKYSDERRFRESVPPFPSVSSLGA
jgi:hypothetical protein